MESILETRGLRKTYGNVVALEGLDLDVRRGEVFGFLGPNGAGKTTFTKCVTGFVRPDRGEVTILGMDALRHPTDVAYHVGLVPDQYDFYSNLTGRQHLDFYGRLFGMDARTRRRRVQEVLELVGMTDRADRRVKGYSHGMKQRICIAQAILHEPELILFDEPTNGLDPKGAYELRQLMRGLARDGTTVFLNSHQLREVEMICERVAIVDKGHLVETAPVQELRQRFSAHGVVRFVFDKPSKKVLDALRKSSGGELRHDGNLVELEVGDATVPDLVAAAVKAGGRVQSVTPSTADLEAVFLQLTGGA